MKMKKKSITIDDLAVMVQRGFTATDKKIDDFRGEFIEFKEYTEKRFRSVDQELSALGEVLKLLREDMKMLRRESIQNEVDIRDLKSRVARLEKEAGLVR